MFARTKLGNVLARENKGKKKRKKEAPVALASGEGALWTNCGTTLLDTVGAREDSAAFEFEAPALCTGQCNAPPLAALHRVALRSVCCHLFALSFLRTSSFSASSPRMILR